MQRLVFLAFALSAGISAGGPGEIADKKAAKIKTAHAQLAILNMAVEAYALDNVGQLPDHLAQVTVKSERGGPYVAVDSLRDPWDVPYRFDKAGKKNDGERPDIWTNAPTGELLGNWQNKPEINTLQLRLEVRVIAAKALVTLVSKAVDVFAVKNNGVFPDSLEDLLKGNKILQKETLLDPWERPFQYDKAGTKNKGQRPDIWTTAPNSKERIGNWQDLSKSNPIQQLYDANVKLARANLSHLTTAVKAYAGSNKSFPESLNILTEGKSQFVLEKALFDPWGKPYQYDPSGLHHEGKAPDIWTDSPRRERIGNWPKRKE